MGIFSRLNTVIKSNLNALVDHAEDPDKLIGQTVEDMKVEVKRARRELVTTLGTAKRLDKKVEELGDEIEGWEEKAVLAVKSGDDVLAREALKRKAKLKKEIEATRNRAAQQATSADEMKDTLEKIEERIEDLKARRSTLAAQVRKARETPGDASTGRYGSSSFDELERMSARIDKLDSEVEAGAILDDEPKRADVDARFRKLERTVGSDAIDDELADLKRRLDS